MCTSFKTLNKWQVFQLHAHQCAKWEECIIFGSLVAQLFYYSDCMFVFHFLVFLVFPSVVTEREWMLEEHFRWSVLLVFPACVCWTLFQYCAVGGCWEIARNGPVLPASVSPGSPCYSHLKLHLMLRNYHFPQEILKAL